MYAYIRDKRYHVYRYMYIRIKCINDHYASNKVNKATETTHGERSTSSRDENRAICANLAL